MVVRKKEWIKAVETSQLVEQQPAVFGRAGKQIAIFRAGPDVFAVDNRCPHEG